MRRTRKIATAHRTIIEQLPGGEWSHGTPSGARADMPAAGAITMPSPFPGMDPYIEGQGWWGFCTQYIAQVQRVLAPLVRPRFVVFIEEHVYLVAGDEARRTRPNAMVAQRVSVEPRRAGAAGGIAVLDAPV